ncbi:MAG: hypothetical protein ACFFD4_18395 [Candidatus Odinarchaeota archaeon]
MSNWDTYGNETRFNNTEDLEVSSLSDIDPYWRWKAFLRVLELLKNLKIVNVAEFEGIFEINGQLGFKEGDETDWNAVVTLITEELQKVLLQLCLVQVRVTRLLDGNYLIGIDVDPGIS